VIIPTYNRANLISYAPGTLDAQTWPRQEIVVVEDGSPDNTLEVLQALAADHEAATDAQKT
jgi:glycosyltransferase involved in cell wall biosynthesis